MSYREEWAAARNLMQDIVRAAYFESLLLHFVSKHTRFYFLEFYFGISLWTNYIKNIGEGVKKRFTYVPVCVSL